MEHRTWDGRRQRVHVSCCGAGCPGAMRATTCMTPLSPTPVSQNVCIHGGLGCLHESDVAARKAQDCGAAEAPAKQHGWHWCLGLPH